MLNRTYHAANLRSVIVQYRVSDTTQAQCTERAALALRPFVAASNLRDFQASHRMEQAVGRITERGTASYGEYKCARRRLSIEDLLKRDAPATRHLNGVFQLPKGIDRCLDLVVRVGGPQRL